MATGNVTTGVLADSLPTIIDAARIIREMEGVFRRTCEVQKLAEGTGLAWDEISLSQLTAQAITETTELNNPQATSDALFSITPTVSGIHTVITQRTMRRLSKNVVAKLGVLAQNAIQRKKDEDYLSTFAGATTTLSGTGTTLASGVISAAKSRIKGNTTERANGPIHTVLHAFQIKDIQDEVVAGVGTYVVPAGLTDDVFRRGFSGSLDGTNVWEAGNITLDSTPDARGAVHAQEAIVMVQGHGPKTFTEFNARLGGGADELFLYDEYAFGERSAGNWLYAVLSDATVPTG